MLKSVLKRTLWPPHMLNAIKASKNRKSLSRAEEDPQLKLYDKILKTDFLHYGYFTHPDINPEKISLEDIRHAQQNYADLIINQVTIDKGNVLDVGCGMGGLIRLLLEQGLTVYGNTPDRLQIDYIKNKYPAAKLIHAKYQKIETQDYLKHFDLVIHSESLQYINLDKAIENTDKILKNDGRWIVVDYFRLATGHEKSGHLWDEFAKKIDDGGFKIMYQQDITENIKPTLRYVHMWGNDIGRPVFDFIVGKLAVKHPGKHYILDEVIERINRKIDKNLKTVDPEIFTKDKKYVLVTLEKK